MLVSRVAFGRPGNVFTDDCWLVLEMHGCLKVYRGSPAAARSYVEADRGRADDYYLAEGTGVAQRYLASPEAGVRREGTLTGDACEAWVGGYDPATGAPKGRVRTDAAAVRFVEVVVNGPKSWSLAAALHPEIAAAYDGAQDRAAQQVIGWLAQHASTRVGPRGYQVQVPVQEIEAAVVRHYTSRAGDPTAICTCTCTCTCRSTPGSSPKTSGAACIPWGCVTAWAPSTASATPQ